MTRLPSRGFLLVLLVTSALTGAGAGVARPATGFQSTASLAAAGPDTGVEMTRTVYRTPDDPRTVDVAIEFRLGRDARDLVVLADGRSEIRSADGFARVRDGRFRWDGHTDSPTLRLSIPSDVTNGRFGGVDFAETADWALVRPYTTAAYWSTASRGWEYAGVGRRYDVTNRVAGEGYAGARFSYLGPYELHTATAGNRRFTVVVPETVADEVNGSRVLDALRFADRTLDADAGSRHLNVFVAPPPIRNGGLTNGAITEGKQDLWVAAASADSRIPIHEYVHTRQSFGTTERTRWLSEATAKFYGWSYAVRAGDADFRGFQREMRSSKFEDAVLADKESWGSAPVDYRKGARVVAAIDARIRRETDGERSFDDVFRRLNARDGPLTHAAFRRTVSAVAGTSLDDWIDRYVTTSASPSYPDRLNDTYYVPSDGDPDDDGLPTAAERANASDPFVADTDGDALLDGAEIDIGADPAVVDTDGDGLDDGRERDLGTNPTSADSDGDGVDDRGEGDRGTDPTVADSDADGLADGREAELGLDPTAADADGDGLDDGAELRFGADPAVVDSDGDGFEDGLERDLGTDPTSTDSDDDGLTDAREGALGTDPVAASGILDYWIAVIRDLVGI